nr:hypothetical protein [Cytophagales bacterium]
MDRKQFLRTGLISGFGLATFPNHLHGSIVADNSQVRSDFTISQVQTFIHPKALFVKISTKEGVSGWGEGDHDNTKVIARIIQQLAKPILMGQDPFESEYLWHQILYQNEDLGLAGALSGALAGIDNALWDLKGKITKLPVYKLLGGTKTTKIKVYGSFGVGTGEKRVSLEEAARTAAGFVENGYDTVKLRMQIRVLDRNPDPDPSLKYAEAVRAAIGDDVTLFMDFNNGYTSGAAIPLIQRLYEKYNAVLVEEPVHYKDYQGLRKCVEASPIKIAAGEHDFNRWDYRQLITEGQADVLNLDVIKAGGLSELKKIASLAQAFDREIMCHNARPSLASAASLHFIASTFNPARIQEYGGRRTEMGLEPYFENNLAYKDGHLYIPQEPGLGLIPNEPLMAKLEYKD